MKSLGYPLLRSICAILLGILLVFWSQSAVMYLIVLVGCLFLIPGLISIFLFFYRKSEGKHLGWQQVLSVGSVLFGASLVLYPIFFEKTLMYALGLILTYAGLSEIVTLVSVRQWARVSYVFYIVPVLVILTGLFILFNPIQSANIPFIILGIACMVYGISDLIMAIRFRHRNSIVSEVKIVEEEQNDFSKSVKDELDSL